MRAGIVLLVMAICATRGQAQGTPMPGPVEVTGKLVRMMAIGAESSGWAIEFGHEQTFGGDPVKSLEVEGKAGKFEKLENKMVKASGNLVHRSGVESHDRTVLEVEKIKELKPKS
jgi:hypothetical protein